MNSIDCLKEKLYAMGCTKSQVESKVVGKTVSILANNPDLLAEFEMASEIETLKTDLRKATEENDKRKFLYEPLKKEIESLEIKKRMLNADLSAFEYYKKVDEKVSEIQNYLDRFFKCLNDGETPDGRDTLKKAQMFINSVDVDTKYDNTAFIVGLSAILSCGKCNVMDEMGKINPIFEKPRERSRL